MASYTVRSDPVTIEAPVETVWRVLTDFDRYGEWNPFTPHVKAELTMGARVDMRVTMGAFLLKQTEIICAIEPPTRLAWRTTIGALAPARRARAAPRRAGRRYVPLRYQRRVQGRADAGGHPAERRVRPPGLQRGGRGIEAARRILKRASDDAGGARRATAW